MRIWHTALIPYLPRLQLIAQWRELNSIFKNQNRHMLINFVYDEPKLDLAFYSRLVIEEMKKRHYTIRYNNFYEYFKDLKIEKYQDIKIEQGYEVYQDKMTDRYLKQCLYNLQEKADCGGISKEEWRIIEERFGEYL